jgi:hypothetical protein
VGGGRGREASLKLLKNIHIFFHELLGVLYKAGSKDQCWTNFTEQKKILAFGGPSVAREGNWGLFCKKYEVPI